MGKIITRQLIELSRKYPERFEHQNMRCPTTRPTEHDFARYQLMHPKSARGLESSADYDYTKSSRQLAN